MAAACMGPTTSKRRASGAGVRAARAFHGTVAR